MHINGTRWRIAETDAIEKKFLRFFYYATEVKRACGKIFNWYFPSHENLFIRITSFCLFFVFNCFGLIHIEFKKIDRNLHSTWRSIYWNRNANLDRILKGKTKMSWGWTSSCKSTKKITYKIRNRNWNRVISNALRLVRLFAHKFSFIWLVYGVLDCISVTGIKRCFSHID